MLATAAPASSLVDVLLAELRLHPRDNRLHQRQRVDRLGLDVSLSGFDPRQLLHPAQQRVFAAGVEIGPDSDLQPPCIIGKAPRGAVEGELPLYVGARATVRPFTTIYAGSVIGDRLQTGQGASIREDNILGDDVSVGTNAVLEFGNRIGNRVRINSGTMAPISSWSTWSAFQCCVNFLL